MLSYMEITGPFLPSARACKFSKRKLSLISSFLAIQTICSASQARASPMILLSSACGVNKDNCSKDATASPSSAGKSATPTCFAFIALLKYALASFTVVTVTFSTFRSCFTTPAANRPKKDFNSSFWNKA